MNATIALYNNPHSKRASDCLCRNAMDRALRRTGVLVAAAHSLITAINSISELIV